MRAHMGKMIGLAGALAGMLGQPAFAFLDTGTLLTNSASATYSAGSQGTSVTYSATAKILVANPAVFVYKDVTPTFVGGTGGTVTYTICFSNGGANTAFTVTIQDRMPNNSYWRGSAAYSAWATQIGGPSTTLWEAWGTAPTANTAGVPPAGQNMFTLPTYVKWTIPNLGIGKSGCIVFALEFL